MHSYAQERQQEQKVTPCRVTTIVLQFIWFEVQTCWRFTQCQPRKVADETGAGDGTADLVPGQMAFAQRTPHDDTGGLVERLTI